LHISALLAAVAGCAAAIVAFRRMRVRAMIEAAAPHADVETPPGILRTLVSPLATALRPTSQDDIERLVIRLARAGRRGREEAQRFLEEKVLWLAAFGMAAVSFAVVLGELPGLLGALLSLLVGLVAADKLLDARAAERQAAITRSLPSAVDLLVTCLDAGLSLELSIARVASDLAHSEPILAEELRLTAGELDAGVALADALRRLARRVGTDELAAMCGVMAQAHSLGAPIAQTLRDYAVASRRARISALEERAGKLATRLVLPLALCLLPASLLIILGPAAIQLMKAFAE
jgi:tight adherence protein C